LHHREHREHGEFQGAALSEKIIGCALTVHRALGPGLLESAYQACLVHELSLAGLRAATERVLPIQYRDVSIDAGYRLDLVVDDCVLVELKAVEKLLPYMKRKC